MAKSKNGGTRAYIRGRIGSDVYSVGKNGKGERQQVVRSLAESVSNPRTSSQMFGRMVMSTVMQAVSALQPIIDHSFDGVAKGQPSISEFIRRNYALIKEDATRFPSTGNRFGLNQYQEKGIKAGQYVVSDGNFLLTDSVLSHAAGIVINLPFGVTTVGGLKSTLGLSEDGYLTAVIIKNNNEAAFLRVHVTSELSDDTTITSENIASIFSTEGTADATFTYDSSDGEIVISLDGITTSLSQGVIASSKVNGAWVHNTCVLFNDGSQEYAADVALPTYPTGTEQFLNGGDL